MLLAFSCLVSNCESWHRFFETELPQFLRTLEEDQAMRDQELIENEVFAAGMSIFFWVSTIVVSLFQIFT
jgi:hypothetical protein